ncbi:MAG TPA: ABC transporter permease [Blastocatellia bacterium]|jgi:predicted permease|nr:ABC transporter permease [Blastocatellia bacterium]
MPLSPRLSSLWRNLFHRARNDQELTEEIDAYLEMLVEQKINEGLNPAEARRAALIEFGGKEQVKEKVRESRAGHLIETFWQDLRYGLQTLGRNPGFTAAAVLSLALGIGANTAIFSLMDAVLLKTLPVKNPEQLSFLERAGVRRDHKDGSGLPYAFFEQLRSKQGMLAGLCEFEAAWRVNVVVNGQAEVAQGQAVSGGFFATLGVNALLGRVLTEDDDKIPGGHQVAVISYNYWRRRFASDPAIVGKSVAVNGHPFTIIGVTPPEFFGVTVGESADLWATTMMLAQLISGASVEEYFDRSPEFALARLRPEVIEQEAQAVFTDILQQTLAAGIGSRLSPERRQALLRQSVALRPASRGLSSLREQFSEPLRILMTVVGLILLIACANVANLLLSRATARKKEIAVRLALGAGRFRLIRQLLTESMLIAFIGGALGLILALWGVDFLLALVGSGRNPVSLKLAPDLRVLGFTAAASLLAGVLFGLAPAWRATQVDLNPALKDGGARGSGAGPRLGLGKTLVVVQVALSLLLLIGAGLFARSLGKLKSLDAGLDRENVLLISTNPIMVGYQEGRPIADLYKRMLERIKAVPGVLSASLSPQALLGVGGTNTSVVVQGRAERPRDNDDVPDRSGIPWLCEVGPEYFETAGMTILRGRGITAQDDETAPRVAVINETFARYYFGDDNPIGRRFGQGHESSGDIEIVGVVKDAKYNSLREPALRTYYVPYFQYSERWRATTFQIRTAVDPTSVIAAVRQATREVDANLPLFNIKTLARQVDESIAQERLIGAVSSFFGLLALLLAAVGLYGVNAYAVSRRTREIGVRMALGARRGAVLRMVLRQGMKLALIGVGLGLAASLAVTRVIANLLFDVTPTDPVTFIGAPILLLIVALAACYVPARRATRVDPLIALRCE